ncbi:hypothetical protein NCC78_07165 [Micromonospora phytophila]|uniref:transposase n=1 Tax=Micromonospora phytophila TaxID=709888 RepID=UPI00202ECF60|nr:transposase [Micromonospora phytophila]MCM0674467.1 hypothetical protein [Micromonospora phytophila]
MTFWPTWDEWLATLSPDVRESAVSLAERFKELGALDPESWARSEISENIPQLARFMVLRALWRPDQIFGDRAYDYDKYLRAVRAKGIRPRIARRGQPHGSGLGVVRWVIERTIAWYHGMKRLRIRWERRDDFHEAFLALATCIITYRPVTRLC